MLNRSLVLFLAGTMMACFISIQTAFAGGIPVTESGTDLPYVSIGTIEVHDSSQSLIGKTIHILTLGILAKNKQESVKKRLMARIAHDAKLYSPDAVIHVEFSPAPDEPRFLNSDEVFAKGEMIKYKRVFTY